MHAGARGRAGHLGVRVSEPAPWGLGVRACLRGLGGRGRGCLSKELVSHPRLEDGARSAQAVSLQTRGGGGGGGAGTWRYNHQGAPCTPPPACNTLRT